jgi:N4-gp56 family major capsid protein
MSVTTYGDISQRTAAYAEKTMLEHAQPVLVLEPFADAKPLPKNTADNIKFRRPIPYAVSTTQLVEGVTPSPKQMQYEDVPVAMGQYGDLVEITDRVHDMAEDPVLKDASMLAGEQAAETKELILWGAIRAGTSAAYSGTGTPTARGDVNAPITLALQRNAVRALKAQRAKPITKMVSASVKFATEAVAPGFIAFAHTDCEQDIRDMDGFTPTERYGNYQVVSDHELGKVETVRYICSPVLEPFIGAGSSTANGCVQSNGSTCDVYPVVYVSKNSYGAVALKGAGSMAPAVMNPDSRDKSDPLGQRGFVAWKMYFAALILNEAWIQRVEVGVTDLA